MTPPDPDPQTVVADPPPRTVSVPSRQFALSALDYGNEGAPPALLVHGMRDLAWSMDSVAAALRDRYRVVSLDLRGHGDSGRPGYYALTHFVSDLHTTVRHFEMERPVLVGHSFGGEVASQLAGIFPELPAACVLIEGLGPPPWEGEDDQRMRRELARRSVESLESIATHGRSLPDLETAVERLRATHPRLDETRLRRLAALGTRPHPEGGICWKWDPMLRTMFGSFSRAQIEQTWQWVECPVLVVTGGDSGSWWSRRPPGAGPRRLETRGYLPPNELERRLGLFADVRCVEIPDAGHMIHFDAPVELNRVILGFLDSLA